MLRSIVFNVLWISWTIAYGIACVPVLALGLLCGVFIKKPPLVMRRQVMRVIGSFWASVSLKIAEYICGITVEVRGLENLPQRPFIIAAKHQSAWETLWFTSFFKCPLFVLKKELQYIPIFGWYLWYAGMVSINRHLGMRALKKTRDEASAALREGNILVLFPEGTRTAPNTAPALQSGVAAIYQDNPNVPVIPVSLNSGNHWGKRGDWLLRPGVIKLQFYAALPSGFAKQKLLQELHQKINDLP